MRKLALLLAAALMVSAPLAATMTTDSYAAAKKATKAKTAKAAPAPKDTGPQPPFTQIGSALGDLGNQLSTYRHDPNAPAGGKGAPAAKGKKK
jgi:hypothetical protein